MTTYRIQHSIQDVDELSKDRYVNVFYSSYVGDASDVQMEGMCQAVKSFFFDPHGDNKLADFYASHCQGPGTTVKIYKVDTLPTHAPLHSIGYSFPGPAGDVNNLPSEVALVLSLKSTAAPLVSPKRTRGRLYIGPFDTFGVDSSAPASPCRPSLLLRQTMLNAAQDLKTALAAAGGSWVIFSPTQAKALDPLQAFAVTNVSVDDAWDTQRRRGAQPTSRLAAVLT